MLKNVLLDEVARLPGCLDKVTLIHESALAAWGIDNNLFPYGIDVMAEGFKDLRGRAGWMRIPIGADIVLENAHGTCPLRVWETLDGRPLKEFPTVENGFVGHRCLDPYLVLEYLDLSPDLPCLVECRAALAMVLFADEMDDRELSEFSRYVRI